MGKSTLARDLMDGSLAMRYVTFDDPLPLAAARSDPVGFLSGLTDPVVLDEVQRVPELFLPLKATIDGDRRPGRFLLTGSANVLFLPKLTEALAGRMEILTLRPLSQGELTGVEDRFVDAVFGRSFAYPSVIGEPVSQLRGRVLLGGYPEAVQRRSEDRRRAWFESYVASVVQRDVRDLANIERLVELPSILGLLAARAGGLLNYADLSRTSGIPQTSMKRYLALLQATLLFEPLPAWTANIGKRLVKSPKVMLNDTGLLASLLGLDDKRLQREPEMFGHLLENFVVAELRKQIDWSQTRPGLFHLRLESGLEVDAVLEDRSGRTVGVEVKASATVTDQDLRALRQMKADLGNRFVRGILLYAGNEPSMFGKDLIAMPIGALWLLQAREQGQY